MKLRSLIREDDRLIPAEVEIILLPGLPQIHVLGLPDQVIRESLHRVRSSLKTQGFEWPKAKQILVNIKPVDRRKSSRGLELAIAAGILWETGQMSSPPGENVIVYGELGLSGEVMEPEDLRRGYRGPWDIEIMTGAGQGARPFSCKRLRDLNELSAPEICEGDWSAFEARRPQHGILRTYTPDETQWLKIMAVGEHHWLLAGVAGSGKSTLARALSSFLRAPSAEELIANDWDGWRPLRAPHHSVGPKGLVGGGSDPKPGEVTRAHGGVLLLDELLEFPVAAQEALREPVETGFIELSRSFRHARYPARFTMVGTTNLCPCGRWVPGVRLSCSFSLRRCRGSIEKISGPFFDRFEGLSFFRPREQKRSIPGHEILASVLKAQVFKEMRAEEESPQEVPLAFASHLDGLSERRRIALLRVARTLADLESQESVASRHFEEAYEMTVHRFARLARGHDGV